MNLFFNWSFDVVPGSTTRSRPVEEEFAAIGVGFDRVEVKTKSTVHAPDGEVLLALPAKALRANKSCAFNSDGDPIAVMAATSEEMQAAITAANTAAAAAATAVAAANALAQSINAIHMLQLQSGVR